MKRKERIEQEIEKTLQCFDSIERIQARPFFFTRLKVRIAKLEAGDLSANRSKWGFIRSSASAFVCLLIILNLISALVSFRKADNPEELRRMNIVAFAEEYALLQKGEEELFLN